MLWSIRRQIAEANGIVYMEAECGHEGDCLGTCPKCDAQIRYLDAELNRKIASGEKVTVSGLSVDAFEKEDYPDIPIVLITHSSEEAIKENMEFGRNERSFATRVEELWQDIMKDYMDYSKNVTWIQAKKSTHYIHLIEPEIVISACT